MIDETISRLEAKLRESSCSAEHQEELLSLLRRLKAELDGIEKTHSADARSISGHTERMARAAAEETNPEVLKRTLREIADSVDSFENSHPQLVQLVNRIATTLANLGI